VYLKGGKNGGGPLRMAPQNVSSRLVELAHVKPGDKVLDIATGIGEPPITGAKRFVVMVMFWLRIYHH
jgi:cyclopropane fatty-acyl-phospholipid synthase-like methyltransferase